MFVSALKALKSLAARLAFFMALMVLLPLAVLNRQVIELTLNPFDLLKSQSDSTVSVPLFMALFAIFALGLLLGYALAGGRTKAKPPKQRIMPHKNPSPASGEGFASVLKAAQPKLAAQDKTALPDKAE